MPWFHPAYKAGGPIQSIANMVKQLAVGSFQPPAESREPGVGEIQFSIFCSNKDLDGTILNSVTHNQWVEYGSNTKVWYSSDDKIIPVLKKEISINKPDLFYIIGLYDWNYNFKPLLHFKKIRKIISVRGMLHPGALSQKSFKKKIYLSAWKMLGWHKKYRFHVTDETEKGYVKKMFGDSIAVSVAGNFPLQYGNMELPGKKVGMLKMVSVALISPMKNIRLVLEALVGSSREAEQDAENSLKVVVGSDEQSEVRSLKSGIMEIEYDIYGPIKDEKYWRDCLDTIKKMPENISVKYHGEIPPAEIAGVLVKHHVFILPSKSENYGHSIIEALSAGLPVITSYATPWNDLETHKAGVNVSTDDIIDIVNAIDNFVGMDDTEMREWSKEARDYAMRSVDVEKTKREYQDLFSLREG